jgi:acyl-CoA synthetase (AMP-forming)/AMP-acid ligase II
MLSRIQQTIADHGLVTPGDRVLVAVSGGPDSTALLFGLARLAQRLGVELRARRRQRRPPSPGRATAWVSPATCCR